MEDKKIKDKVQKSKKRKKVLKPSPEEKEKRKFLKKQKKIELKKQKAEDKINKVKTPKEDFKKITPEDEEKFARESGTRKPKKERNFALYFREWPIAIIKEAHKIKWLSKKQIGIKFLWIILFILVLGALFYFADMGIALLFKEIKIIKS